jgi:hypothetical protein
MAHDLSKWTQRPKPRTDAMEGRYVRLEKLDPDRHADDLFDASAQPDGDQRFRWLPNVPPTDRAVFRTWVEQSAASEDPLFFAVIDKATGKVAGRQTFMRMDPANGVAEIGHIYWGRWYPESPQRPRRCFSSPGTSSTISAIAVSNGSATTKTCRPNVPPAASASNPRECSTST